MRPENQQKVHFVYNQILIVMSGMLLVPPFLSGITKIWRDNYTRDYQVKFVVNAPLVVPTQNLSGCNGHSRDKLHHMNHITLLGLWFGTQTVLTFV